MGEAFDDANASIVEKIKNAFFIWRTWSATRR
jgi:hypothetical protein